MITFYTYLGTMPYGIAAYRKQKGEGVEQPSEA